MAKIISIWNAKGGVGKTNITLALASCLIKMGYSCILCDLDSQSSLSKLLGFDSERIEAEGILTTKDLYDKKKQVEAKDLIYKINDKLSIIPSVNELNDTIYERNIWDQIYTPKNVLKKYFSSLQDETYILVDSVGATNTMARASLCLCDFVISPALSSKVSLEEIETTFETINETRENNDNKPNYLGIILNMSKENAGIVKGSQEYLKEFAEENNTFLYDKIIRYSQAIPESEFYGKDINSHLGNFDFKEVKFKVISKKDMEKFKKMSKQAKADEIFKRIAFPKKITSGLMLLKVANNYKIKYKSNDKNIKIKDFKLSIDNCPYGKSESEILVEIINNNNESFKYSVMLNIVKDNVGYDFMQITEQMLEKLGE